MSSWSQRQCFWIASSWDSPTPCKINVIKCRQTWLSAVWNHSHLQEHWNATFVHHHLTSVPFSVVSFIEQVYCDPALFLRTVFLYCVSDVFAYFFDELNLTFFARLRIDQVSLKNLQEPFVGGLEVWILMCHFFHHATSIEIKAM